VTHRPGEYGMKMGRGECPVCHVSCIVYGNGLIGYHTSEHSELRPVSGEPVPSAHAIIATILREVAQREDMDLGSQIDAITDRIVQSLSQIKRR
jgi:hypothetical protein